MASRNSKKKCGLVSWLGFIVKIINVGQIIALCITLYVEDKEKMENDWKYYPEKPLISDIPIDWIFGLWIFCLVSGLVHNILFDFGEYKDFNRLMKISIWIGIIKEIVRFVRPFEVVQFLIFVVRFRWKLDPL